MSIKRISSWLSVALFALFASGAPGFVNGGGNIAFAQSQHITGTVVDDLGEPIIGANIRVPGTTKGTITDIDGKFTLEVSQGETLEVSFVGYATKKVTATAGMVVTLSENTEFLDDVVVIGYGVQKKKLLTGATVQVKGDDLQKLSTTSALTAMQSQTPGVIIMQNSGQAGEGFKVNIRGIGTVGDSNPLYVIDGVPVQSGSINTMDSDAGLDIMSTINTSDIENITIIKDAAAASLYGSRAANGVVLITTKQGKEGKAKVSFKADWGFSDFAMEYRPVMSGAERREYIYNGLKAAALRDGESESDAIAYADEEIDAYAPVPWCGYVDWDDILFKKGDHQTYEASIAGGTDKFKYYSSLSYLKQDGIALNSGLERISGRVNVDYQATNKLKLGANMMFATVNQDVHAEGTTYTSPFYSSRNCVVPSDAVYYEDGSWNREFIRNSDRNPLLSATYDYQREYVTRSFNTVYAQYEFVKNLIFKSTFSYDYTNTKGKDWSDPRTSNGDDDNGYMTTKFYEYKKMVWANQLSYKFDINDYLDILSVWYRDVLLFKATNDVNHLIFKDEIQYIKKVSNQSAYEGIEIILDALEKAKARLRANVNFELTMELLLLTIKEN